ncbi:hypothetical protein COCNU_scaffold004486G000020 [Cocos nucifera]|nr:hypothetical protein [Cocos nucifera]
MMRSFVDEKENPLLWASTYHAGECLDPVAVAEAKVKRKAKKPAGASYLMLKEESYDNAPTAQHDGQSPDSRLKLISKKQMAVEGFKAQSEMVIESLDRLITTWEDRKESVIIEGVHLSLNFVRKGSSRHLMALINKDGSVAKAWLVDGKGELFSVQDSEKCVEDPVYGLIQIGKSESVNLQFGNFGISGWPNDIGSTSQTASICDSGADGTDAGSRYFSSCCSSPRISEGPAKELKEESSVSVSEEADDPPDVDSSEDESDIDNKEIPEEMEGSVDEELTKSDEEFDDLAIRHVQENGYWSDDEKEPDDVHKPTAENKPTETCSEMIAGNDLRCMEARRKTYSQCDSLRSCSRVRFECHVLAFPLFDNIDGLDEDNQLSLGSIQGTDKLKLKKILLNLRRFLECCLSGLGLDVPEIEVLKGYCSLAACRRSAYTVIRKLKSLRPQVQFFEARSFAFGLFTNWEGASLVHLDFHGCEFHVWLSVALHLLTNLNHSEYIYLSENQISGHILSRLLHLALTENQLKLLEKM